MIRKTSLEKITTAGAVIVLAQLLALPTPSYAQTVVALECIYDDGDPNKKRLFAQVFDIDLNKGIVSRRETGMRGYRAVQANVTRTEVTWQDPSDGQAMKLDRNTLNLFNGGPFVWTCRKLDGI